MAEGRRVSQLYGCIACHSIDPTISMLGPTWKGLYGSARSYAKGTQQAVADVFGSSTAGRNRRTPKS